MILAAMALAAAPLSDVQVLGIGTSSCGSFSSTSQDVGKRLPYVMWMAGFLSGYNVFNRDSIADVDARTDQVGEMIWLDRFCAANPLLPYATAVSALIEELKPSAAKRVK